MRVELSIKDDTELRNMIKDMIRGAIRGLTRQEVLWRIQDEIFTKMESGGSTQEYIDNMIRQILREYIHNTLHPKIGRSVIEDIISEEVKSKLREI